MLISECHNPIATVVGILIGSVTRLLGHSVLGNSEDQTTVLKLG